MANQRKSSNRLRRPREEAREARNQLYREHILQAAERVFAERGFESAKLQEISTLAGLSMGTIYSIFASKDELFLALLEERGQQLRDLAREVAAAPGSARAALERLIEAYIDYFVAHPTFLTMHLKLGHSWVLAPAAEGAFVEDDPEFFAKLFSAMDQVVLAQWAARGMKAGREALIARLRSAAERAFYR